MSVGTITLATPLANGGTINLRFLMGVQQEGKFNYCAVIETLPFSNSTVTCFSGSKQLAAAKGDKPTKKDTADEF